MEPSRVLDLYFFRILTMPTVTQDNASGSDANAQQTTPITEDVIKTHPLYKELEEKHSAARTGMDKSNLTKKQLEAEVARLRVLAGEDAKIEETKPEPSPYVTKEELWETQHAKELELYGDEQFKKEVEQGIPRHIALNYAKLRYEKAPNNPQVIRQQSMASAGSTSTRDLSDIEITDEDRRDMKEWGFSEATLKKHKALKKARGL